MSILNTAPQAVQSAASSARGSLVDLGVQALKFLNTVRAEEYRLVGSALERVGLQRRESSLRPIAWFAAGAVLGGSAVLLLAPSSGGALRRRIGSFLGMAKDATAEAAKTVVTDLEEVERSAADSVAAGVDQLRAEAAKKTEANGREANRHEPMPRR